MDAVTALLVVSAFHAGFQVVVSGVVYPALADVPVDRWATAHDRHSHRIVRVVAVLYPVVVAVCLWALVAGPVTGASIVAVAGNLLAVVVTAGLAAPAHGRLGRQHSTQLISTLLIADRVRTVAAVVALAAACLI
ncbi:hypothetical protein [Aeromicrobium sp. CF3.5]|uniref:hypothetical protein n=1 Tax=Aeromicrobium sp. CF3.5 TaxID=3373078 RepID=UPI003EE79F48